MKLILRENILIDTPIEYIIHELKREANWDVFKVIQNKGDYLSVTCPMHKDGMENRPSCSIYISESSDEIIPGTFHCFTCGAKGQLYQLVSYVLGISEEAGIDWLTNKFGSIYDSTEIMFPKWDMSDRELISNKVNNSYLDESILKSYAFYHPYVNYRKIDFNTARQFQIGWNKERNTVTFPVWDEHNNLVMITERSIDEKKFYIPSGVEKPVYLLNFVLQKNYKYVIVCESQFNALTCWSYGLPAVALFGTGTDLQYDILKKSHLWGYILCFDGDEAGRKGSFRFQKALGKESIIYNVRMPQGKDVNDLSKDDFFNILRNNQINVDNLLV